MSPKVRLRQRMRVRLNMVMALAVTILVAQLWLFTTTLDAMENRNASPKIVAAAIVCSLFASMGIWTLIRFFLKSETAD